MKTIGIMVAMDKEMEQLRNLLEEQEVDKSGHLEFVKGRMAGHRIVLTRSGIGKVNAAIAAVELIRNYQPDLIVSSGCAGGTGPLMNVTDVVAADRIAYHDVYCGPENLSGQVQGMPAYFETATDALQRLQQLDLPVTLHVGTIVSGDWFVDSMEKMRDIFNQHPDAMAVDMESAAIAQTCYLYHKPFLSIRVISDLPLQEERQEQYSGFWNKVADNSFTVIRQLIACL